MTTCKFCQEEPEDCICPSRNKSQPKWKPKNPCDECERQLFAQMESSFTIDGTCVCLILAEYTQKITAQKTILEYLLTNVRPYGIPGEKPYYCIEKKKLEQMLKELGG